jgi:hypothetical protein
MTSRTRFIGSGRVKEGGFLATHKQDFIVHTEGGDWRHKATQLDMDPSIDVSNSTQTVQEAFEFLRANAIASGVGFVTIGDGYTDVLENAIEIGQNGITDLNDAFTEAFSQDRLVNGGIILLKAGSYELTDTVDVPAGITIMGEVGGTNVNCTPTNVPAFKFLRNSGNVDTGDETTAWSPNVSRMFNLNLFDNLGGSEFSGLPAFSTVSMIQTEQGASVNIEHCSFIGRIVDTGGSVFSVTRTVIEGLTGVGQSSLEIRNCYFDSVQNSIRFRTSSPDTERLIVEGNRSRQFSLSASLSQDHSFISTQVCDISGCNNYVLIERVDGYTAIGSFIHLQGTSASFENSRVVLIGNRGGLVGGSALEQSANDFILDGRTTPDTVNIIKKANAWGGEVGSDWIITVGDGSNSIGDITGEDAFDILNEAFFSDTENKIIYVNSGSYTCTSPLREGFVLIGNRQEKPIITLGSDDLESAFHGSYYENKIAYAENIKFSSGSDLNELEFSNSGNNIYLAKNCEFENVKVKAVSGGIFDGCTFTEDNSSFDEFYTLEFSSTERVIVRDCLFNTDLGYGVYLSSNFGGSDNSGGVVVENCTFDQRTESGPKISSAPVTSFTIADEAYIRIESDGNILFTNNKIFANDDGYLTIAQAFVDAGYERHVSIAGESVTFRDNVIEGINQVSTTFTPVASLFIQDSNDITIDNNIITGVFPLNIEDTNDGQSVLKKVDVSKNRLSHYQLSGAISAGIESSNILSIVMPSLVPDYGKVTISDNQIFGYGHEDGSKSTAVIVQAYNYNLDFSGNYFDYESERETSIGLSFRTNPPAPVSGENLIKIFDNRIRFVNTNGAVGTHYVISTTSDGLLVTDNDFEVEVSTNAANVQPTRKIVAASGTGDNSFVYRNNLIVGTSIFSDSEITSGVNYTEFNFGQRKEIILTGYDLHVPHGSFNPGGFTSLYIPYIAGGAGSDLVIEIPNGVSLNSWTVGIPFETILPPGARVYAIIPSILKPGVAIGGDAVTLIDSDSGSEIGLTISLNVINLSVFPALSVSNPDNFKTGISDKVYGRIKITLDAVGNNTGGPVELTFTGVTILFFY